MGNRDVTVTTYKYATMDFGLIIPLVTLVVNLMVKMHIAEVVPQELLDAVITTYKYVLIMGFGLIIAIVALIVQLMVKIYTA